MKNEKNNLGNRMKRYENVNRNFLTNRTPVIVRIDGKAFHSFTKGCNKPFDDNIIKAMIEAAKGLANEMQGFKIGYVQSDEASFLLTDYDDINTSAWFDNNINKIVSVSASIFTAHFNDRYEPSNKKSSCKGKKLAYFDARAFNVPESDVSNYFMWRAKDWERNSLQMFAMSFFSHKQLHLKNRQKIHEMLHLEGKNWYYLADIYKNGTWICKDGQVRHDIIPTYDFVNKFVEEALNPIAV